VIFTFNLLLLAGIAVGLGFLVGKGTHLLKITGVVGYIITGVVIGPDVLGIIHLNPGEVETITNVALGFVAFIIGGELTRTLMKNMGKSIVLIILGESFGAFILVFFGVYILTHDLPEALVLAAMAPASAPAGTIAVLQEYKAKGKLTDAILAVVGFDDALAIFIYAFSIALLGIILSSGVFSVSSAIVIPLLEIIGALVIGIGVGGVFSFLLRRLVEREEILAVAITAIFFTAGLSLYFGVSLILACMALGMMIINIYPMDNKPVFDHVKSISLPIYILFFVVAGVNLHMGLLLTIGLLGGVYVICRTAGLIGGSYLAALASKIDPVIRNNLGLGILSQAGVAIGLALLASHKLAALGRPELGSLVITTIAATTVVFAIIGPLSTRFAIMRAGEARTR
jgi:Kef-type K+ transport system membrane component KefB